MKEDEERGARREPWLSNDYFVIVLPTALDILLVLCLDLIDLIKSLSHSQGIINISRRMKICVKNFSGYVSLMPDFEFRLRNEQANVGF